MQQSRKLYMFLKAKTPKDYKIGKAYEPVLVNLLMPVEHQSQRDLSKKKSNFSDGG